MNLKIRNLADDRLPMSHVQSLSLSGTSADEVQQWVANLPMLNVGDTAKQLYTTLQELAAIDLPSTTRLELMELLRPAIYSIIESLSKHYINQNLAINQRAGQIAALAHELRAYSAMIYHNIALNTATQYLNQHFSLFAILKKKAMLKLIGQATHRGLAELFYLLSNARRLHLSDYTGMWLGLHELYTLAQRLDLRAFAQMDKQQTYGKKITVEQMYLRSIFLSACHTNKLRQAEIKKISQLSEFWTDLVHISPAQSDHDLLWVDTKVDAPPMYTKQLQGKNADIFHIDVHDLLDHFQNLNGKTPKLLHPDEDAGLSTSLKLHLLEILNPPKERASERQLHDGTLTMGLGFISTHYQLAGQCSFEELIEIPALLSGCSFKVMTHESDLYDAPMLREEAHHHALDNYFASHQINIINSSDTGYCLHWIGTPPSMLRTGELISLRKPDDSGWRLGLIRWVQQDHPSDPQFGVEILSEHGIACGARVIIDDGNSSDYMRTLLIPNKQAQNQSTLLTPTRVFKVGHKISIRLGHDEFLAMLTRELVVTQSFSQFEFVLLPSERSNELISKMLTH